MANTVPADFDFEWSFAEDEIGNNPKFKEWMTTLLKLTDRQTSKLLSAKIGNVKFPISENFSDKQTEQDVIKFGAIALIQFLKIKEIRKFLRNLIKLNDLKKDRHVKNLITGNNIFESLFRLHSDLDGLFRLPATQKVYKSLKNKLTNIENKKLKGIVVQYTANYIGSDETDDLNISDDEKEEFLAQWSMSVADKIQDLDNPLQTVQNLDVLAQTLFEVENRISSTNVSVDPDGNVHFELNEFAQALQGVSILRLRLCEYCEKLFWANRKDTFTCSPKHARNRRMRLLRESWKNSGHLYLNARKMKTDKKKENKKNGSL